MKIILRENQLKLLTEILDVERYQPLKNKIESILDNLTPKYDWYDGVDVDLTTTMKKFGWKNTDTPVLIYLIKFNDDKHISFSQQEDLKDYISFIHSMVFPLENKETIIYSAFESSFPNGEVNIFPLRNFPIYF